MSSLKPGQIFYSGCQHKGNLKRYKVRRFLPKRGRYVCTVAEGPKGRFRKVVIAKILWLQGLEVDGKPLKARA
jgi:hypothetical protein